MNKVHLEQIPLPRKEVDKSFGKDNACVKWIKFVPMKVVFYCHDFGRLVSLVFSTKCSKDILLNQVFQGYPCSVIKWFLLKYEYPTKIVYEQSSKKLPWTLKWLRERSESMIAHNPHSKAAKQVGDHPHLVMAFSPTSNFVRSSYRRFIVSYRHGVLVFFWWARILVKGRHM